MLVSFTTRDFVNKGLLGRYTYDIKTLLSSELIKDTTVAVNFDDDMYTREAEQERTYETSTTSTASVSEGAEAASSTYKSKSTDSLLGNIGRGGLYTKEQSSLLPGDILTVSGVFATNSLVLHTKEFLTGLSIIALIAIAWYVYRKWRKKNPKQIATKSTDTTKKLTSDETEVSWGRLVVVSIVSISLIVFLSVCVSIVGAIAYGSSISSSLSLAIVAAMVAVVPLGGIVAPMAYVLRYGPRMAMRWVVVEILVILVLIFILGLASNL